MATTLDTWSGKNQFRYEFNRNTFDVQIFCGANFLRHYSVDGQWLRAALTAFSGKDIKIGTHRTKPPAKSIGQWFKTKHKRGGIMSYLGPILIKEEYAKRGSAPDRISIL